MTVPTTRWSRVLDSFSDLVRVMLECDLDEMWPTGQCLATSLILAPIIRASEKDYQVVVANGSVPDCNVHAWLMLKPRGSVGTSYVIDPTAGQFEKFKSLAQGKPWLIAPIFQAREIGYFPRVLMSPEAEEKARSVTFVNRDSQSRWASISTIGGRAILMESTR